MLGPSHPDTKVRCTGDEIPDTPRGRFDLSIYLSIYLSALRLSSLLTTVTSGCALVLSRDDGGARARARSPPEGRPSASRRRLLLQPTNGAAMEEPAPVPRVVHTAADDGSEGAQANTGHAAVAPCGGRQCARAHVVHSCATGGGGGGRHHAKKRAELGRGEQDSRRGPLRCGASHVRLLPRLGTADEILLQCLRQANL